MALSRETIEQLHDSGKMPDWAYYQQNGRSAQSNYRKYKKSRSRSKDIDDFIVYNVLLPMLEKALKEWLQQIFQQ